MWNVDVLWEEGKGMERCVILGLLVTIVRYLVGGVVHFWA
jgi:hypothetical protein